MKYVVEKVLDTPFYIASLMGTLHYPPEIQFPMANTHKKVGISQWFTIQYVTRSGKRYISAQKFEIALCIPLESALRWLYDDANPAFVAFSCHVL